MAVEGVKFSNKNKALKVPVKTMGKKDYVKALKTKKICK